MITIQLPWTSPPLHANQRMHWAEKARETSRVRNISAMLARGMTITPPVEIELIWTVSDHRHRDAGNLAPLVKALVDGIQDAGVIPGDHSDIVVRAFDSVVYGTPRSMRLEIRSIT